MDSHLRVELWKTTRLLDNGSINTNDMFNTMARWIAPVNPAEPEKSTVIEEKELVFDRMGNGYNYEAAEVMDCLRKGQLQSDIVPHAETLAVMKTMDTIRKQWGLTYPMEK